jgi:hypothetical protein
MLLYSLRAARCGSGRSLGRALTGQVRIFRKAALLLVAAGGAGLTIVILLILDFKPVRGTFGGAVVFAAFLYLFWLLGWHSKVRMDSAGVVVDNLLVRHVIPWAALAEIDVDYGLDFRLRDGRKVGSIMYGGSVAGSLLGYKYTRSVATQMREAQKELCGTAEPAGGSYARRSGFSPWPPLACVAIMEAVASLSLLR